MIRLRPVAIATPVLTCRNLEELACLAEPVHLALGVFDGVHAGHQAVLAKAIDAAAGQGGLAGLVTFDPHPIRVIAPAKAPSSLLATLDHKADVVAELGIRLFVPLRFDHEMAAMEAGDFLRKLTTGDVRTIAVGEDWRFGHDRSGDANFLRHHAAGHGYRLEAVPPVMYQGDRISSTRIRQAVRDGNLSAAAEMLGRPYSICGTVVVGEQLGRKLGFPTANLATGNLQLPPTGVWAVRCLHHTHGPLTGVANLGTRPSLGSGELRLEVHLLGFSGDLYGEELDVEFIRHLRPEKRFDSLDELRNQIRIDSAAAREFLRNKGHA